MKRHVKSGLAVVAAASLLAVGGVTSATAAKLITGKDIKDGSVTGKDVKDASLGLKDLSLVTRNLVLNNKGDQGATGAQGAKGDTGAQGPRGATGAQGDTGAQGPRGATGATGAQGPQGETGAAGAAGAQGAQGPAGPQGPAGQQGPAGPAGSVSYQGANWGIVHRNVVGNGDADLQSGPRGAGSLGDGALMIRTGSGQDKAAYGNEVDYLGDALDGIGQVSYWAYTTGENNAKYAENNIGITFEIDPTGPSSDGPNYTSLVYVPVAAPGNAWTKQDGTTAARWYMTGAAGNGSCNQGPEGYCTLDQVKAKFPHATVLTVQLTKGRDYAFSGAADRLQINSTVYDFEPFGVYERTVS